MKAIDPVSETLERLAARRGADLDTFFALDYITCAKQCVDALRNGNSSDADRKWLEAFERRPDVISAAARFCALGG